MPEFGAAGFVVIYWEHDHVCSVASKRLPQDPYFAAAIQHPKDIQLLWISKNDNFQYFKRWYIWTCSHTCVFNMQKQDFILLPQEAQSVPWVILPQLAMPSGTGPGQYSRSGCWLQPAQPVFCSLHRLIFSLLAFACALLRFKTPPERLLHCWIWGLGCVLISISKFWEWAKKICLQLFGELLWWEEGHWIKAQGDLKAGRASVPTERVCDPPVSMGHLIAGAGLFEVMMVSFSKSGVSKYFEVKHSR